MAEAFHKSEAFVRGLMGPVGSSKSSACCMEIFSRATEQRAYQGVRWSRWGVIRSSYRELETTTLATWLQWFGPLAQTTYGSPIKSVVLLPLPDGTRVNLEVLFFPISRPDEIDILNSLELNGIWMNEARELMLAVLNKATERAGRFPPVKWGGPSWRGVIMDTNSPDDDHWWYRLAEGSDPKILEMLAKTEATLRGMGYLKEGQKLYEFFKQPGGLIEKGGEYQPNPAAENISNLDGGYAYYYRQLIGKSKEWIKAQILGQYASVSDGKGIYPEWNDEIHCRKVEPISGRPLLLGFDYGLTPACVICQVSPRGQLLVIDELFAKDMGPKQFARDVVKPHLALNYGGFGFQAVGDPAGIAGQKAGEKTVFMDLAEEGIACVPARTNDFQSRREAVAKYLTRMTDGLPCLQVSPNCDMIRRGFNGRYQFKRLQVVGEERYRDVPDKNDYSHLHDALQYAALHSTVMDNEEWGKPLKYPSLGLA